MVETFSLPACCRGILVRARVLLGSASKRRCTEFPTTEVPTTDSIKGSCEMTHRHSALCLTGCHWSWWGSGARVSILLAAACWAHRLPFASLWSTDLHVHKLPDYSQGLDLNTKRDSNLSHWCTKVYLCMTASRRQNSFRGCWTACKIDHV